MVPGLKSLPYEQRLIKLHLWSLEERRVHVDLIEVYKIVNGICGINLDSFFEYDNNDRTRGHSTKLRKKRFNTDLRKHFFTDRIINIWNALDDRTVTSANLNSFKNGWERSERIRNSKQLGLLWLSVAKDLEAEPAPPSGEASSVSYQWVIYMRWKADEMARNQKLRKISQIQPTDQLGAWLFSCLYSSVENIVIVLKTMG